MERALPHVGGFDYYSALRRPNLVQSVCMQTRSGRDDASDARDHDRPCAVAGRDMTLDKGTCEPIVRAVGERIG